MGSVNVQYKERRGANEAGQQITNPVDYFNAIAHDAEDWNKLKALYDACD